MDRNGHWRRPIVQEFISLAIFTDSSATSMYPTSNGLFFSSLCCVFRDVRRSGKMSASRFLQDVRRRSKWLRKLKDLNYLHDKASSTLQRSGTNCNIENNMKHKTSLSLNLLKANVMFQLFFSFFVAHATEWRQSSNQSGSGNACRSWWRNWKNSTQAESCRLSSSTSLQHRPTRPICMQHMCGYSKKKRKQNVNKTH